MVDEPAGGIEPGERDPLDAAIKVLYCVAIAVNVVIVVDVYTDGKLSAGATRLAGQVFAPVRDAWERHRTYREQKGHVLWDAIQTVDVPAEAPGPASETPGGAHDHTD